MTASLSVGDSMVVSTMRIERDPPGPVPYFACTKIKTHCGYDDALDVFGVHGVGGTVGLLLTGMGVLAHDAVHQAFDLLRGDVLACQEYMLIKRHGLPFLRFGSGA